MPGPFIIGRFVGTLINRLPFDAVSLGVSEYSPDNELSKFDGASLY